MSLIENKEKIIMPRSKLEFKNVQEVKDYLRSLIPKKVQNSSKPYEKIIGPRSKHFLFLVDLLCFWCPNPPKQQFGVQKFKIIWREQSIKINALIEKYYFCMRDNEEKIYYEWDKIDLTTAYAEMTYTHESSREQLIQSLKEQFKHDWLFEMVQDYNSLEVKYLPAEKRFIPTEFTWFFKDM